MLGQDVSPAPNASLHPVFWLPAPAVADNVSTGRLARDLEPYVVTYRPSHTPTPWDVAEHADRDRPGLLRRILTRA